jgi:predicted peroxiredoxin
MWSVMADGQPWVDPEGQDNWRLAEAVTLADMLKSMGYEVEIVSAV